MRIVFVILKRKKVGLRPSERVLVLFVISLKYNIYFHALFSKKNIRFHGDLHVRFYSLFSPFHMHSWSLYLIKYHILMWTINHLTINHLLMHKLNIGIFLDFMRYRFRINGYVRDPIPTYTIRTFHFCSSILPVNTANIFNWI